MPTSSPIDIGVDELLTTTRAVRKRLDLTRDVDDSLLRDCTEIAMQAPTSSNMQDWHFVFVRDAGQRAALAELYREAFDKYRQSAGYAGRVGADDPERAEVQGRVASSAEHLAAHLHEVPVHLVPCVRRRARATGRQISVASLYGSVLPAVWNFMLAARSRGLGTAWTTLHLMHEEAAADILGIPFEEVTQTALIPVAHYTGEGFQPGRRIPLSSVTSIDHYGEAPAW